MSVSGSDEARGDSGAALVLVLLLLLALTLVSHGALFLARHQLRVARASAVLLRSRLAAESGARILVRNWPAHEARALSEGALGLARSGRLEPGGAWSARIRRLSREIYLVESEGSSPPDVGSFALGRAVWAPDGGTRIGEWSHGLLVGGDLALSGGGLVEGGDILALPPGWDPARCESFVRALGVLFPGGVIPGARPNESETAGPRWPEQRALGYAGWNDLLAGLPEVQGTLRPGARVRLGACQESDPDNWGAPSDPTGPCGGHFVGVGADSLRVLGGEGQGILVVAGDLVLGEGHRFAGTVLVGGDLVLQDGARVDGLVRVGREARIESGSLIRASPCAAALAMDSASVALGAVPVPEGSWLVPL